MKRIPLLVTAFALSWATPALGDEAERSWQVDPDVRVDIEIISGRIEIKGWNRDEVRVRARGAGRNSLEVEASPDWISIRAPRGGQRWFEWSGGIDVDLDVRVPRRSRLRAKTINGPIKAEDVEGIVDFQSANGRIEVKGETRDARLETVNQNIKFEGDGGRVDAHTIGGSIELKGVADEVIASTMNGSIKVEGGTFDRIELSTMSGSIELEAALAPRGRAQLKTYSGSVKLKLPDDTSARFDVQSFSGQIETEFGNGTRSSGNFGNRRRLDFEAGDGEGRIVIETFSGQVRIEKGGRRRGARLRGNDYPPLPEFFGPLSVRRPSSHPTRPLAPRSHFDQRLRELRAARNR
jgi:hypothetical protein